MEMIYDVIRTWRCLLTIEDVSVFLVYLERMDYRLEKKSRVNLRDCIRTD